MTEGEDLLEAARAAGAEPVELLSAAGEGLGGTRSSRSCSTASRRSARAPAAIGVWRERWAEGLEAPSSTCTASPTRGTSAPSSAPPLRSSAARSRSGRTAPTRSAREAVRASMGAVFTQPLVRAELTETPAPRAALVAHGGEPLEALGRRRPCASAPSARGCPAEVVAACETRGDDPAARGRRVAQRRRGGGDRDAADIVARARDDGPGRGPRRGERRCMTQSSGSSR